MNKGDAASWKEELLEDALSWAQATNTDLNLGSHVQFKHDLKKMRGAETPTKQLTREKETLNDTPVTLGPMPNKTESNKTKRNKIKYE
jgi:hypothetical protein